MERTIRSIYLLNNSARLSNAANYNRFVASSYIKYEISFDNAFNGKG